jgi:hypothetical protein
LPGIFFAHHRLMMGFFLFLAVGTKKKD